MDKFASTFFKKPKTSPRSRSSAGNSAGSPVRTASSISTGAQYPGLPATELPSNYAPTRTGSEVSLPPGYEYVMQNEPQSLFLQDQVEEQGCYHRVAFTFMVRLRIAPTTNQPLEAIFADLVELIHTATDYSLEWRRLVACVLYLSKPTLQSISLQGILAQECFKTGKFQLDLFTKRPTISFRFAIERTALISKQYRSVNMQISLFSNQCREGMLITSELLNEKSKMLGKLVNYKAISSPNGLCISFI